MNETIEKAPNIITYWIEENEYIETPTGNLSALAWLASEKERFKKDGIKTTIQKGRRGNRNCFRLARVEDKRARESAA